VRPLPLACPAAAARLPCRSNAPLFPASVAPSSLLAARRHRSLALPGPLDCAVARLRLRGSALAARRHRTLAPAAAAPWAARLVGDGLI